MFFSKLDDLWEEIILEKKTKQGRRRQALNLDSAEKKYSDSLWASGFLQGVRREISSLLFTQPGIVGNVNIIFCFLSFLKELEISKSWNSSQNETAGYCSTFSLPTSTLPMSYTEGVTCRDRADPQVLERATSSSFSLSRALLSAGKPVPAEKNIPFPWLIRQKLQFPALHRAAQQSQIPELLPTPHFLSLWTSTELLLVYTGVKKRRIKLLVSHTSSIRAFSAFVEKVEVITKEVKIR